IASISTPVRSRASATASTIATPPSSTIETSTCVRCTMWQSGMSSLVRFAAWMPAMRAAASTSPFFVSPAASFTKVSLLIGAREFEAAGIVRVRSRHLRACERREGAAVALHRAEERDAEHGERDHRARRISWKADDDRIALALARLPSDRERLAWLDRDAPEL